MSQDVVIKGIVIFPKFFVPKPVKVNGLEKGEPFYSCRLVLDTDNDWAAMDAALREGVQTTHGAQFTLEDVVNPYHDATQDGFPGQWSVNATSAQEYPPEIYDENVNPVTVGTDGRDIKSGHRVAIYARASGYTSGTDRGAKFYMNKIQFLDRTLPVIGGSNVDAKTVFQPVPGAPPQVAPTAYSQPTPGPGVPQGAPGPGNPSGAAPGQSPYPATGAPAPAAQPAAGYPSSPPPLGQPQPAPQPGPGAPGPGPAGPYPYQQS